MKLNGSIFAVLVACLVLIIETGSYGVDTRQIDEVLKKAVLTKEDLVTIDNFIAEGVRELASAQDLTDIAKIRTAILTRQGNQAQYVQQFFESARKYIGARLQEASGLTPEVRRVIVTINLLILADNLQDPQLAEQVVNKLKDKSTIIRYWAVHCLTNPGIVQKLNSGGTANAKLAQTIAEQLKSFIENSRPEEIALVVRFAGDINIQNGEELLSQITDMRLKRYADWTVEYELLDGIILKQLYGRLSANPNKPAISRRFGQLYSYVIQRYAKGKTILSEAQKQQLISVMAETEDKCVSKLLGKTQTGIKRAIEKDDTTALLQEHNRLLGDQTTGGELATRLKFDYGSPGSPRTAPLGLPEPPSTKSSQ